MVIPHIMFHPDGKVVEETAELFKNQKFDQEEEIQKASFFLELHAANLP